MARYVAHVPLRWTDQDSYRHVNHARTVTLLEEARIGLLFTEATAAGVGTFGSGLLVAGLEVDFRRQIPYGVEPLRVTMAVRQLRAASFTIDYDLHGGAAPDSPVAAVGVTRMAMVDLDAGRPRRLTPEERAFLQRWDDTPAVVS
ncbi:MAG: thioesterase family protein [Pseudonocardia sp.]|nr:thioesterase family protein [Pseudonocardia sp.]